MPATSACCAVAIVAWCVLVAAASEPDRPSPLGPAEALAAIDVLPGFVVEAVATEPLVRDPIAFDWGADGKLWVVEMGDYPLGADNHGRPGGCVRSLEDADGDGRYDTSSLFLDGLLFPSGVMTWRRGVLVACAPEIFYAEDTDGDGRADKREVLFSGFGEVNPQHRVNGLRWGLDNWVYCANGDFAPSRDRSAADVADGGAPGSGATFDKEEDVRRLFLSGASVRSQKTEAVYDIRNRDFRFRPDEGLLDAQAGQSQFGRDRDDWGNWFGCNNATPMWHFVLADEYLRRNPFVPSPDVRVPHQAVTFPVGSLGRGTGSPRGREGTPFTSACGITIYRDELLGPDFSGNWFVCEPVHNLVHREVLVPEGVTFASRRPDDEPRREFLSSADPWFSPVMVRTGPDGALWVADMYRLVLEHPNWLPPGWEDEVDVRAGDDRGRIYRVFPAGSRPGAIPRMDRFASAELVAALSSPNGWLRDKAQQLLIERRDPAAVELLEQRLRESPLPLCRLHCLCALDGLSALDESMLLAALADSSPGVRRHAVRLCERRARPSLELVAVLAGLVTDPDLTVRLQLAYSLGTWHESWVGRALGRLILLDTGDPNLSAAAMSSVGRDNLYWVIETVFAGNDARLPPALVGENLLRTAHGCNDQGGMAALLDELTSADPSKERLWQFRVLAGWLDFTEQRNTPLSQLVADANAGSRLGIALARLARVFDAARATVREEDSPTDERKAAVGLLGRGFDHRDEDLATLAVLLVPQSADDLQAHVVDSLGRLPDPAVPKLLLRGWQGYGPSLRARVLEAVSRREEWLGVLLDALEQGSILGQEVDAGRRQYLLEHPSEVVRGRAASLLAGSLETSRNEVVEAYRPALDLPGDVERGRRIFEKTCVACHRPGDAGRQVGPDLATVREKPPEWFLPALFDPSQAVDARYVGYTAVTRDGLTFSGVLAQESGNSITLVGPMGQPQTLLRADLERFASNGKSAMPEGFERELRPEQVADLIAYLRAPAARPDAAEEEQ